MTIIIGVPYPASVCHALKLKATRVQAFATQAEAKHCVFAYVEGFLRREGGLLERQHEEDAFKFGRSIAD